MATKVIELAVESPDPDEIELWDGWFRVPFPLSDSPNVRWRDFFDQVVKETAATFDRQIFLERGRDQVVVLLDVGDELESVAQMVKTMVEKTNFAYRSAVEEEARQMASELARRQQLEEGLQLLRRQAEGLEL